MKLQVIVIGLGRFGSATARELHRVGHEVLAIDRDETTVNDIAREVTHAVQLDASDEDALAAVGAGDFGAAIVAIGSSAEASIFATMALKKLGVPIVVAKASTALHGSILERVGADRVVYPEQETGTRVAHSFAIPNILDYLDIAPQFGVERVRPPRSFIGRTLREINLQGRLKLTPIALRRGSNVIVNPHHDEVVREADELILIGRDDNLEQLVD
ncbi:MAG: TrkA family potassium uptake protein [Actinomycetota bacterium]